MSENILKNVTKKGLLKLKKSKPIPITAHTGEIIIPVAYTETVKKMLDKKGIKLPLSRDKLAKLRKIAQKTEGELSESDTDEGESYAKGTANLKGQTININIDTQNKKKRKTRRKRKTKLKTVSGLIEPPKQESLLKTIKNPNINVLRPNDTFSLIRPITYSASTPVLDYKKILDENLEKEKVTIKKREEELKEEVRLKNQRLDALERSYEEERRRNEALIRQDLLIPRPREEHKYRDKDEEREVDEDIIGQMKDDIKGWKRERLDLDDLKEQVIGMMNIYKSNSIGGNLTQAERERILECTNQQDIFAEYIRFARILAAHD